jgi:hypothetical protein
VPSDKADAFFFVGRGAPVDDPENIVELNCHDTYMGLPEKVRAIVRWAYDKGYDYVLKCDDDCVLNPVALLDSDYRDHDYTGRANRPPTNIVPCWVPTGFNYWISRKGMECILDATLPSEGNDDEKWVALLLHGKSGITLHDDLRYKLQYGQIYSRPLRPVVQINRPLRVNPNSDTFPGTFSWCIFLEGNSGNSISIDKKVAEFHKVFNELVKPNL